MAVDIKYLKSVGISSDHYKPLFTNLEKHPKVKKLVGVIADRIRDGREANLKEYRTYWAIDVAHETPFAQTTPTLVQALLSKNLTAAQTEKELAAWGLSEKDLFLRVDIPNGHKLVLNPPVFYQIMIPVVRAYHTARTAGIFNERDRSPLFSFVPKKQTDKNRVLCDIWTDIIDTISGWYGYPVYLKQSIQQMLKYGVCLAFPMEEWHCEKQKIDGEVVVQKEGLRYVMPHPTRMRWDLYHPLPTINTDTGCEYAFHWNLIRYGDVQDNPMYWNRETIMHSGKNWLDPQFSQNYFREVFPCNMKLPTVAAGPGMESREQKAAYYSSTNRDDAVFITTMFWKIIPKDWGLGDYEYPVWHRFDVANDETIIWAAPCAYTPVWFMGYDWDSASGMPSSLSLETIPWQDHLGNILSQMILTAKQNLANLTYYDTNLVEPKDITALENLGEQRYRGFNFVPFDSIKLTRTGMDQRMAFHSVQFPIRSVVELQSMLSTALNLMERVLQFTAQEVGSAASHYQSAKEIGMIKENSNQRRSYTASGVDDGIDAWKKQLVDGAASYMDNRVVSQVSTEIPNWQQHIEKLGFTVEEDGLRNDKAVVAGTKQGIRLETFARTNVGPVEAADPQIAQVIFQTIGVISQQPEILQQVGIKRVLKLLERGAKLAGAPADFDITTAGSNQGDQNNAVIQQIMPLLEQLQKSIMDSVVKNVAEPAAKADKQQQEEINSIGDIVKRLEGMVMAANQQPQPQPQPVPVPVPIPQPQPQPPMPPGMMQPPMV